MDVWASNVIDTSAKKPSNESCLWNEARRAFSTFTFADQTEIYLLDDAEALKNPINPRNEAAALSKLVEEAQTNGQLNFMFVYMGTTSWNAVNKDILFYMCTQWLLSYIGI